MEVKFIAFSSLLSSKLVVYNEVWRACLFNCFEFGKEISNSELDEHFQNQNEKPK